MELTFDAPVAEHHFAFRCLPMTEGGQTCYGLQYGIEPSGLLCEITDGFGNRMCTGEALDPHDSLNLRAEGTVYVDRSEAVREELHPLFLFPSAYTAADESLRKYTMMLAYSELICVGHMQSARNWARHLIRCVKAAKSILHSIFITRILVFFVPFYERRLHFLIWPNQLGN